MAFFNHRFFELSGIRALVSLGLLSCGGLAIDCEEEEPCGPLLGEEQAAEQTEERAVEQPQEVSDSSPTTAARLEPGEEPTGPTETGIVVTPYCDEAGQYGDRTRPPEVQDLIVETQAEIDALAGCREIWGDLRVFGQLGTDLSALSELVRIEGALSIRGTTDPDNPLAPRLDDLGGLSGLRYVGSLSLSYLAVTSLGALENLSEVGPNSEGRLESFVTDGISINDCNELTSLRGLRGVEHYRSLELSGNQRLSSFGELKLMEELSYFQLAGNPALRTISHAPQRVRTGLSISSSAFVNLDALEPVQAAATVFIANNASLQNITGLRNLQSFREMTIRDNPSLTEMPGFPEVTGFGRFQLVNNSALLVGPEFPNLEVMARGQIFVTGNSSLPALTGFATLRRTRSLVVANNASLVSLDLSSLETVSRTLEVRCNRSLPAASVASLTSFSTNVLNLEGNGVDSNNCESLERL